MNKISVIVPCYNAGLYLRECLRSVMDQTYKNIEIICINDGSSDNTLAILTELQAFYPHLFKIISISNQGASVARNVGLQMAEGEFIQFLDADDVITADKFEKQLKGFDEKIDVVISDRVYKNHDLTKVLHTYYFDEIEKNSLETAIKRVIITSNPLYRKQLVLDLKGYNEKLSAAQDWDFHLRMILSKPKIKYIPGVYFISRKVENSISSNWVKVSIQAAEVIIQLKAELLKSNEMNKSSSQYLSQIFMDSAIFVSEAGQSKRYFNELLFWSGGDYSFIKKRMKKILIAFFGIKTVILLHRTRSQKYKGNVVNSLGI